MSWKLLVSGLCAASCCVSFDLPVLEAQQPTPLRDQATVRLTFDEESGPALDSALVGDSKDIGNLVNDPVRVSSPFWNQTGKRALQFDMARQQYVELADAADLDRPDSLTFSLLGVNLLDPSDAAYHGLVAKRGVQDGKTYTNYGINFTMQSDTFQVYINDGRGYRVVQYSTKAAFPVRKLLHLTATFQVADAPAQDADADADDVRIQFFVNGQPLPPKASSNGFVNGNEGWITDVEVAGLVNNLPVTIGRSEAAGEYFQGVVDEFLLFPKALSLEESKQLFLEVAGNNVEELIKLDQPAPAKLPDVARLTQPGFTIGQTTQVAIVGKNLLPDPQIVLPVEGVTTEIVGETKDDRLAVRFTVAPSARPGIYPLYLKTANGISDPQPIAIDILPHVAAQFITADKPAALPVAVFGALAGGQEPRVYFQGTKGQRIVADLELKRLGGKSDPVLELKTAAGTPLTIAWGEARLEDDVRLESVLPADGLYFVELHDLIYRAPGPNSYRLKVGDLKLVDVPFPVAGAAGPLQFEPVGPGIAAATVWSTEIPSIPHARWAPVNFAPDSGVVGPWPYLAVSDAIESVEMLQPEGQLQTIDATLADPARPSVAINGRLLKRGEKDVYLLNVTPGHALRFRLQSQSLASPVAGEIEILGHPQGNRMTISGDQPQDVDPTLDFGVPAGVTQVRVAVRDLLGRGSPRSVYRLVIAPTSRPEFALTTTASAVQLPNDGSAIVELNVNRTGYNGPIVLSVAGDAGVQVAPALIPTGVAGKILCRLQRTQAAGASWPIIKIVGTTVDQQPPVARHVERADNGVLPTYVDALAYGATAASGLGLELLNPPTQVFKGAPQILKVKLQRAAGMEVAQSPVRMTTRSTENVRQRQPNNPAGGTFPIVQIAPSTMIPAEALEYDIKLEAPLDIADPTIEFVLAAEAVPHAYSERVIGTAYSPPFRVTVHPAVAPKVEPATLTVPAEAPHMITGQLQRTSGFLAPVTLTLIGLPAGYTVVPAEVAADQNEFKLTLTAPAVAAETAVPNVKLRVTTSGSQIAADQDVAVKVVPKQ